MKYLKLFEGFEKLTVDEKMKRRILDFLYSEGKSSVGSVNSYAIRKFGNLSDRESIEYYNIFKSVVDELIEKDIIEKVEDRSTDFLQLKSSDEAS